MKLPRLRPLLKLVPPSLARSALTASCRLVHYTSGQSGIDRVARSFGVDVVAKHYYSPIPDPNDIGSGFWEDTSELPGLTIDDNAAMTLAQGAFSPFLEEFRDLFPIDKPEHAGGFYLLNGTYMAVDAHVYYSIIRHFRPRRIVEIGSGQSALVAAAAIDRNVEENGTGCDLDAVEPFPSEFLEKLADRGDINLVKKKAQDVPWDYYCSLTDGDILFIDSTHVLREGNDVQYEYLEILPRLNAGVLVHVHDISLPRKYPKTYFEQKLYWNEQYLLQAFLAFNDRFEILWPSNYMMLRHSDFMLETFSEINAMRQQFPYAEPTAFWMRVRGSRT